MAADAAGPEQSKARAKLLSLSSLLIITLLLIGGVYLILAPFAEVLLAASMLTVCFYPLYEWVHSRVRNSNAASLLCIILLLVLLLAPLTALATIVAREARSAYAGIQRQSAEQGGWANYLGHAVDAPVQWISARTGMPASDIQAAISERSQTAAAKLVSWSGRLFGNVAATTTDIVLTLFVMLFLLPIGERFGLHLHEYVPIQRDRLDLMLTTMKSAIVANLYGMIAVAASQGALVGIGFALTGLPSPVFWAVVASFASLIPLIGTAMVVLPATIALAVGGAYGKALFLLIWGIVVVGMSDNFIRPMVLRRGMEMNTLVIFLSLMGGVQAFGFIGLFAGPVIATMAFVMLRMLNEERIAWQKGDVFEPEAAPTPPAPIDAGPVG
jgi:predicted PurR-regulated permease PerM